MVVGEILAAIFLVVGTVGNCQLVLCWEHDPVITFLLSLLLLLRHIFWISTFFAVICASCKYLLFGGGNCE